MRNGFFAMAALAGIGALLAGLAALVGSHRAAHGQPLLTLPQLPEAGRLLFRDDLGVALGRRLDGSLYALDPICPYLGCRLKWQPGQGSFLCPCHGGHFSIDGSLLAGLAPAHLRRFGLSLTPGGEVVINRTIRFEMVGHRIPPDQQYPISLIPGPLP